MRKRRQKFFRWILCATFILLSPAALTGCGGGGGGGAGGQEQSSNWDTMIWDRGNWR